jgi:hypothetical protein
MAFKKGHEIATIDVAMVTITVGGEVGATTEIGLKTATQIQVDPSIETTDAIKLIVKGVLIAQKRQVDTLTGNTITLTDNVFNPELVKVLQGGTITYGTDGAFESYTPPVAGAENEATPFTLNVYAAHYDASGIILDYEKTEYPNCTGVPVSMSVQDDTFTTPAYSIISAPGDEEAPYKITMVKSLPELGEASWAT